MQSDTVALKEVLRRCGRIPPDHTLRIVGRIADQLDARHRNGLVHTGLTVAGVSIDAAGTVRVTAARIPGDTAAIRAELIALAELTYRCLTGTTPPPDASLPAILALPPVIAQLVTRSLDPDTEPLPADRFARLCHDFADRLPPSPPLPLEPVPGMMTDPAMTAVLPVIRETPAGTDPDPAGTDRVGPDPIDEPSRRDPARTAVDDAATGGPVTADRTGAPRRRPSPEQVPVRTDDQEPTADPNAERRRRPSPGPARWANPGTRPGKASVDEPRRRPSPGPVRASTDDAGADAATDTDTDIGPEPSRSRRAAVLVGLTVGLVLVLGAGVIVWSPWEPVRGTVLAGTAEDSSPTPDEPESEAPTTEDAPVPTPVDPETSEESTAPEESYPGMPDVVGMTYSEAGLMVYNAGFTSVSGQFEKHSDQPPCTVLSQYPDPGTPASPDIEVVLVSSGSQRHCWWS